MPFLEEKEERSFIDHELLEGFTVPLDEEMGDSDVRGGGKGERVKEQ